MKLVHKDIEKDNAGQVTLIPEEAEDMWHTYNLLQMGAYHTIELELNRKFTLAKKVWDSVVLDRIEQACDPAQKADVAAVVMQEGLANLVLVTPAMTLLRAKALERFYEAVMQGILRHFSFDVVKCILVASPGFVKDQFISYLFKEAAAGEVKALEDFYKMLQQEPDRAFYGLAHVERASEALAVDILLISDKLFRHQDIATRSRYVRLVDNVKENGGNVRIFSSLHVSGDQLNQLSGVAAILRFPIADVSEAEEDSSSDED
ncbi:hypothetical protein cypCar_00006490 [Cyprinus carpio]|nr:hypothetical protein cypCar_00006490 [Cyprinus carpio]